jgi:cysteine-rich repeat protein
MSAPSELARPSTALPSILVAIGWLAALTACGGHDGSPAIDAGPDAQTSVCGDAEVDPGEDCDDGDLELDVVCDTHCHFTCGNGAVDATVGEACDSAIAAGQPGACPTDCDDDLGCTTDVLSGIACQAACMHSTITATAPGDGCCPTGASNLVDNDCPAVCGNSIIETGERCDTGIAAGMAGACPAGCNDGFVCTTDTLMHAGMCTAECVNTQIVNAQNGDACCPPGATPATDTDCNPGCGNGALDPGETCDTGIAAGPGSCITTCTDGMVCTRDTLINGGTCTAACSFSPISAPMNSDGCCPAAGNSLNDNDCPPRCGNALMEAGEQCDDGNFANGDGCNNGCVLPPTAFRFGDLDIRDPHVFVSFITCQDVTDAPLAGFAVNPQIQETMSTDADGDGLLDLAPTLVFRPLAQGAAGGLVEFHFARCTAPVGSTSCSVGTLPIITQSTNLTTGTCLGPVMSTVHTMPAPYAPAITTPMAPCFVTNPVSLTITLSGIPVPLRDARLAATYSGNPAQSLVNGLLMGFITEADANTTILPANLPLIGGKPLSYLLPGGDPPGADRNCAPFSDMDTNNGTPGWWFYVNFPADRVPWTSP